MSDHILPPDASRLGLRYRDTTSVEVDWDQIRSDMEGEDVVVHPRPGKDVLEEYGLGSDFDLSTEEGLQEAIEAFEQSDAYYEWKDANSPKMNFLWECETASNVTEAQAAELMARYAGATCLISYKYQGEEIVGIALTGGGMNLAHDLAAAYVCMGQVPPAALLDDALSQIMQMSPEVRPLVVESAGRVAESLRWTAERLDERASRARAELSVDAEPAGTTPRA